MASTLWFLVATATVAPEAIEQIVVTGSRIAETEDDAPVRVEVVTRERIEQSGSESVAELLEEHGGVQIDRSFRGATVEMQGLSSEYVLVLVDGQRAIGRTDDAIDLSRFPVDRVERIELVKGASSALYGADALGGVINIITRGADRPLEAAARLAYGRFDTLDLAGHVAGHAGPFELRLSAGWHRADAYDLSPEDPGTTG
ncbi:MAG: TonB-dependent receptor plug domain-containing protein, partial [Deltaproteobacteria bacterium]